MSVFMEAVMEAMHATQGPMMRPDLFKCAVSEAGLYDINAQYKSGDIRWARGGKEIFRSDHLVMVMRHYTIACQYINKLKTPFMIIHGGKDIRTPYQGS